MLGRPAGMAPVVTTESAVPFGASVGIESSVVIMVSVPATIADIYSRPVVEEVPVCVEPVYGEVPSAGSPDDGSYEVVGGHHQVVLPVVQYVAEVRQPVAEVVAVEVPLGVD